jgi:cell volume regulation protein A
VPILLAAFALLQEVPGSERIYGIVFVVVAFSVIVQGGSVPFVARRLGIPMRLVHRGPR